jgi:hypothetical protein
MTLFAVTPQIIVSRQAADGLRVLFQTKNKDKIKPLPQFRNQVGV